jgi:outer membrane protein assembly factor BamD
MAVDVTRARVTAALPCDGPPRDRRRHLAPERVVGLRICVALILAAAAACATAPTKPPAGTLEPDRFLMEHGTDALNKKRWLTAREYFRQLVDSYPQSSYRAEAKLGIGDTYIGEGSVESYVLAINEFREFLSYYPNHKRDDYAQYKLGMAHYKQMHGSDRDQTETREAIVELSIFMQRYPTSALASEVRPRLREARDRYSDYQYGVGYFYFKTMKYYPASVDRFLAILKDDAEYTRRDGVYFYLAQSLLKVKRPAEALPYLDRLEKEFEQSQYLEEARKLATTLKAEMNKKAGSDPHVP